MSNAWQIAYRVAGSIVGATASAIAPFARGGELHERLGYVPPVPPGLSPLWLHGASVGELATIRPLVSELRRRWPGLVYGVTATTPTGRRAAASELRDATFSRLLPLDGWPALGRFLNATRPGGVIIVETELWPGLLGELSRRDVPVALASARMSPRSHVRYARARGLFRRLLAPLVLVAARTEDDRARFVDLGIAPERTLVAGNTKLDLSIDTDGALSDGDDALIDALAADRHVVIWGCLRPLEHELALSTIATLGKEIGTMWILAPRHLTDFDPLAATLERNAVRFRRWSEVRATLDPGAGADVLVLDTLGELRHLYAKADVAVVGGTFDSYGGHNLMEPARYAVPVVFGPDTSAWPEDAARLVDGGGGIRVHGARDLADAVSRLLGEPTFRSRAGRSAREAANSGRGASERIVDALEGRGFFDAVTGHGCGE